MNTNRLESLAKYHQLSTMLSSLRLSLSLSSFIRRWCWCWSGQSIWL